MFGFVSRCVTSDLLHSTEFPNEITDSGIRDLSGPADSAAYHQLQTQGKSALSFLPAGMSQLKILNTHHSTECCLRADESHDLADAVHRCGHLFA